MFVRRDLSVARYDTRIPERRWTVPLFAEGAPEGDVLLHRGVEQPGLLGCVGHRVAVLTEGVTWETEAESVDYKWRHS